MPPSLFERFQSDHTSGPKIPIHAGEAILMLWGHNLMTGTQAQDALSVVSGQPLNGDAVAEALELRASFPDGATLADRAARLERGNLLRAALQALEAGVITPAQVRAGLGIGTRP